jgi:hypothetical protein
MANIAEAEVLDIFDRIVSHALTLGVFESVNTHEPKNSPGSGVTCAIWIDYIGPYPSGSGMAATTAVLRVHVRLYTPFQEEPSDAIDPKMLSACMDLMGAYSGDFDLGSSRVRCVDLLGMSGIPLNAQAGYVEINRRVFRVMTISLPLILDDSWAQAQ